MFRKRRFKKRGFRKAFKRHVRRLKIIVIPVEGYDFES